MTAKKQKTSYTLTSSDGDFAYSLIKKNKNRFTKIEFINYLTKELNKKDIHDFKMAVGIPAQSIEKRKVYE